MKLYSIPLFLFIFHCNPSENKHVENPHQQKSEITCDEKGCFGTYSGAEFIQGEDIAHQFSNKMSRAVGDELKTQYRKGNFKKVDFSAITMSTKGLGTGIVNFTLQIPFKTVRNPCEAYTSFDHVGGWNHRPELEKRMQALSGETLEGHSLDISDLKKTPEGLVEYWIQWKNKSLQSNCE